MREKLQFCVESFQATLHLAIGTVFARESRDPKFGARGRSLLVFPAARVLRKTNTPSNESFLRFKTGMIA